MSFLSIEEVVIHVVDIEPSAKFYIGAFDLHMLASENDSILLGVLNSPSGKIRLREVREALDAGRFAEFVAQFKADRARGV